MEQVLEIYKRPYDSKHPVVCMDEQPKQLISEISHPIPATPGRPERVDYEYVRHGVCTVWMFVEALKGWRDVRVTETRTAVDWAHQVQTLVDAPCFADAERITLVQDNLNTHTLASLYQAFEPAEALRIARRLELVYTPRHGSWLNVAEPELSVLTRQCLDRRIPAQDTVAAEARAWAKQRNETQTRVDWHFTTEDARIRLRRLYPKTDA